MAKDKNKDKDSQKDEEYKEKKAKLRGDPIAMIPED